MVNRLGGGTGESWLCDSYGSEMNRSGTQAQSRPRKRRVTTRPPPVTPELLC